MVRYATRGLKIGVQSWFDPKFDVGKRTFFPENFGQAYYVCYHAVSQKIMPLSPQKIIQLKRSIKYHYSLIGTDEVVHGLL